MNMIVSERVLKAEDTLGFSSFSKIGIAPTAYFRPKCDNLKVGIGM